MTCTVHNNREAPAAYAATFSVANRAYALQDANFNVTALVTRFTLIGDGGIQDRIVDIIDLAIVANHFGLIAAGGEGAGDCSHNGRTDASERDAHVLHRHARLDTPPPMALRQPAMGYWQKPGCVSPASAG